MTGGAAVVATLETEGVRHVFGLIGSAAMEVFDALYEHPTIAFVGVRDERTGTHMADGYARASGSAGVFLAGQNGPGATNTVTGLAQAHAAYSPVVVLAGALSSAHVHRDAFQEVDQQALFRTVTKRCWTVTQAARLPEGVREAFRTALAPRRGPVALNLPRDLLAETREFAPALGSPSAAFDAPPAGNPTAVVAAARLLAGAERPLIIAGGGVKNGRSHAAALRLAEVLKAPVATSPGHGDAIPCTHPLYAGQVGPRGNAVASRMAREADVILALGTRLGFNTTFYTYDHLNPDAKIVQVETEPTALARFFPVAVAIHGDAGLVAESLAEALRAHDAGRVSAWRQRFRDERDALLRERDAVATRSTVPMQPAALFKALRDVAPLNSLFTLDAGTLCLQATDQLPYAQPPALLTPLDFGLVGFSYACGLGAKLARPDRTVISLMGDGGFGMTMSEIGTAVQNRIHTVCVVMNNGCWGAEKAYQRDFFGGRYIGADVPNPRYDKVAELFGAAGYRVEKPSELSDTLRDALDCGRPAIVDVMIDPDALYSFRRDSFQHRAATDAASA
jgi:thiamine pyrophosphate-dependent acetolactate synthase large subunit-like protein